MLQFSLYTYRYFIKEISNEYYNILISNFYFDFYSVLESARSFVMAYVPVVKSQLSLEIDGRWQRGEPPPALHRVITLPIHVKNADRELEQLSQECIAFDLNSIVNNS